MMTTVQTFRAASGGYSILSSRLNLWTTRFGRPDSTSTYEMIVETNVSERPVGIIYFQTSTRVDVTSHAASEVLLSPQDALAQPIRRSRSYSNWRYATNRLDEDAVASLAAALVLYQQDFCTALS